MFCGSVNAVTFPSVLSATCRPSTVRIFPVISPSAPCFRSHDASRPYSSSRGIAELRSMRSSCCEQLGVELLLVENSAVGAAGNRRHVELHASRALQIRLVASGEHRCDIRRLAAACRGVERIDRLSLIREDQAGGFANRLIAEGLLPRETDVGLTGGTGADVVSLAAKLAEVADGVGASGDGLGLQSFDLIVDPRSHLRRHDAAEIVLEIELVDDVEKATAVDEDARGSAVGPLIDGDRLAADWHDE